MPLKKRKRQFAARRGRRCSVVGWVENPTGLFGDLFLLGFQPNIYRTLLDSMKITVFGIFVRRVKNTVAAYAIWLGDT